MRGFFASILIMTIVANWVAPYIPYVDYYLHQDYIANTLCINKDKPELSCHGKCHLDKEIKKVAEKENPDQGPFSNTKKSTKNGDYFCSGLSLNFANPTPSLALFKPYLVNLKEMDFKILIPPPEIV